MLHGRAERSGPSSLLGFALKLMPQTHTLLSALHPPLPNTPIYILPTTLTHSSRPLLAPVLALHGSFAIIHIILYCSTSIHVARLLADKEHRHARGKISDEASLMELKMEDQILHLVGGPYGAGVGDGKVAAEYEINTTVIDAKMVAGLAAEYAVQGLRNAGVFVVMEKRRRP